MSLERWRQENRDAVLYPTESTVKHNSKGMPLILRERCQLPNYIAYNFSGHMFRHTPPVRITLVIDVAITAVDIASRRHFEQDCI
jgi:hypothetical protein